MNGNANTIRGRALAAMLFLAGAAALAAPAHAYGRMPVDETWAQGRVVDVQLQVDGDPAPLFWAPGRDDRRYFEAFAGQNYSVVLRNNSARRVGVLLTVDGLNVVNGERSHFGSDEAMYVLDPWESATIRGWRTSLNEVRRFVFVDEARSYASRTDQANGDMGWIRVMSFKEKQAWTPWLPNTKYRDGQPYEDSTPQRAWNGPPPSAAAPESAPQAKGEARDNSSRSATPNGQGLASGDNGGSFPGTGWGQRANDRVNRTHFDPESRATDQLVFRYEYASGLQALGIFGRRDRLQDRDNGQMGFARPPRWR